MNQITEDRATLRRLGTAVLVMCVGALGLVGLAAMIARLH